MEEKNVELESSIMVFRLGNRTFAFPVSHIQFVSQAQKIHGLPHQKSPLLKGVVNVQGQIKIALSLHPIFNITSATTPHSMILVGMPGNDFVFLVDELLGVNLYSPLSLRETSAPYIKGQLPPAIDLIDTEKLFAYLETIFHA